MALTGSEKQELARKISKGVQVVSSSIAQLHLTSPDPSAPPYGDDSGIIQSLREYGEGRWKFTQIEGALLLTKDPQGICHFRIYDLGEYKLRFQYELYENLDYQKLSEQVHAFEMESCVCGFTFSSVAVAEKFFSRVQNSITRNNNPGLPMASPGNGLMGSQRNAPPPLPKGKRGTNKKVQNQTYNSPMQKSFNGAKSVRKKASAKKQKNIVTQNGAIDPNNVPKAWKRILKKAGIRKKDLRNPQMFEVIRDALAQHNIDLSPPDEINYDDPSLQQDYPPEQLEAWKKYQAEMKKFEEDKARYEREMAEYERQMAQEEKLQKLMQEQNISFGGNTGMSGAERIRASVMQFQGKDIRGQAAIPMQQHRQLPRMSVARPNLPNVPAVAPKRNPIQHLMDKRASKVVIKAGFLADIKKKEMKLKRVSVLPEIRNLGKETEGGLLAAIKKKMQENRLQLTGGESDDEDAFSTFSDE